VGQSVVRCCFEGSRVVLRSLRRGTFHRRRIAQTLGIGFIRSVPSGAATQRGGKQLAEDAGVRRSAAGRYARSADFAPGNLPGEARRHNDFLGGPPTGT